MQPYNENGQAVVVIHIVIGQYTCMRITMLTLPVILDRIHTDKPV